MSWSGDVVVTALREGSVELQRKHLTTVASNNKNTLRTIPTQKKGKTEKIAVGDRAGTVHCFSLGKNQSIDYSFKEENAKHTEVTALTLGSANREKIFVAFGQTIQGLKKKGKQFFRFNTSLNEDITSLFVEDLKIWTSGEYVMNMFDNYEDSAYVMSPDRISQMTVIRTIEDEHRAVLACQDRSIRIVKDADIDVETSVEGPVTTLIDFKREGHSDDKLSSSDVGTEIIFGTENGMLGQCLIDEEATTANIGFVIGGEGSSSTVNCIGSADINGDGVADILVGRDDGSLEVWGFDQAPIPDLLFSTKLSESVTSLDAGRVFHASNTDIVLSTYSGKIFGYAGEVDEPSIIETETKQQPQTTIQDTQIASLRNEIQKMTESIDSLRGRYQAIAGESNSGPSAPEFNVKANFRLVAPEACYLLSIETDIPIDMVALQCSIPVMLVNSNSNFVITSRSPPDRRERNELLTTLRCTDTTNRIEVKLRMVEGQHGTLNAYVIPRMRPQSSQKVSFEIKPLSLHQRISQVTETKLEDRSVNTMTLSGEFSIGEVHSWLLACLPDVSSRMATEGTESRLLFESTFLGTNLLCIYTKGKGVFKSDSLTAISILQETISKQATLRNVSINISLDINPQSVTENLELLRPKLDYQYSLATKKGLIDPLREIQAHEPDLVFFSKSYRDILSNAERIEEEYRESPRHLEFLKGIVTDLFVDKHKLQGRPVPKGIDGLLDTLQEANYSFDALIYYFHQN